MKKILPAITLISFFLTQSAFAENMDNFDDKGVYLVGQAGVGTVSFGFFDGFLGSTDLENRVGPAGRVGMGYQVNRYFALEGGLSAYSGATRVYDNTTGLFGSLNESSQVREKSDINGIFTADLMGSLRVPMGNYFFMNALAGIAATHFNYSAMHVTYSGGQPYTNADGEIILNWDAGSANFLAPKAELRLGYKIDEKTALLLSASYIFSVNGHDPEIRNYQPGLGMFSIGVEHSL